MENNYLNLIDNCENHDLHEIIHKNWKKNLIYIFYPVLLSSQTFKIDNSAWEYSTFLLNQDYLSEIQVASTFQLVEEKIRVY